MSDYQGLVVHIIDRLPPDGAERLLVDVLKCRSQEFDFTVLCLVSGGDLEEELQNMNIPVRILGKKRKLDLTMFIRLVLWLRTHKPAVVHTHLFTADSWGRLAAALVRVPTIYSTVHSTNSWKNTLHRSIDRVLAMLSTKIIACSTEVANVLVKRDRISQSRIETVPNGISLARFEGIKGINLVEEFHIAPKDVFMAMVGRLHPSKGHLDILPIMQRLKNDNISCHLIVIGDGELRGDIQKYIHDYQLEQTVSLAGQRKDVLQILSAVDILVMPSRWEGLPIALLEGMALGKAVLATAVGGIPEVIQDGKNGLLAAPGDKEILEFKLRKLIENKMLRQPLGRQARSTVYTHFSAASVARRYESLYRKDLALYQRSLCKDGLT